MNDAAVIVERLRPLRLPAEFAAFGIHDALALFGAGLLVGLVIVMCLRLFIAKEPSAEEQASAAMSALRREPTDIRLLRLAKLRADLLPGLDEPAWHDALYRPRSTVDFEQIETEILTALRDKAG